MVHFGLTTTAVLLYAVNYLMRVAEPVERPVTWGLIALSTAGMLVVTAAAVAGAALVHRHAVGPRR